MCPDRGMIFAEPYIMLSQLHWGYHYGDDPVSSAKAYLQKLVDMKSAKREFFTNLGLLKYSTERHGESDRAGLVSVRVCGREIVWVSCCRAVWSATHRPFVSISIPSCSYVHVDGWGVISRQQTRR